MRVSFRQKGDFKRLEKYLTRIADAIRGGNLDKYGREGVAALSSATPVDTGLTAKSWYYRITGDSEKVTISFHNSNIQNGVPVAIILQYGHATKNGGWVEGRDYINPAIRPIFDSLAKNAWREVTEV